MVAFRLWRSALLALFGWALLAPQLASISLGYPEALIRAGEVEEATAILQPLANSPHHRALAQSPRRMIARANGEEVSDGPDTPDEEPAPGEDQAT